MPGVPANQDQGADRPIPEPPGPESPRPQTPIPGGTVPEPSGDKAPLPAVDKRSRLETILMPVGLAVLGLALLFAAFKLYPRTTELQQVTPDPAPDGPFNSCQVSRQP
jgi:hypothetical protein